MSANKKKSSMRLATKLGWLVACALIGVVVISGSFLYSERTLILEERKATVRQVVEAAHATIAHFGNLAQSGKLSEQEAKQRALETLEALRYNGQEYFWVNTISAHPIMVMHPVSKNLIGTDLSDISDPTGKRLFVEMTNLVEQSEKGYVFYLWPKPGSKDPIEKVSYVQGYKPWGWMVGSGVYIDTVQATIMGRLLKFGAGTIALGILLLLAGILIARSVLRQIGGEPEDAANITQHLAAGDLYIDIELKGNDHTSLLYAMKNMRDSFANIVKQVRSDSEAIATATAQIASGNQNLSTRTEEQASSLEETASSMEQLTSTVRQNAENASQANQLAISASDIATNGGNAVQEVVQKMHSIDDSSRKMADIINVIDGIAFQTNILALNAAVEAARAGEQGRGFAVVATEVRNLAQRSAKAAQEIKDLINDSVSKVEDGSKQAEHAGETVKKVVDSIRNVRNIMEEITAASTEQSDGIEQVNRAIMQMDSVTQQNAALVEEAAAAAESLRALSKSLVETVKVFKIRKEETS
ncbi:MAG: putative methyl-accepting chemotaxis protein [Burkholderiaceae bacterium]|nr:putative methyl-accepting chemotaxis protein [Burkholderiaceae bacterium]